MISNIENIEIDIQKISLLPDDILVMKLHSCNPEQIRYVTDKLRSKFKELGFKNEVLVIDERTEISKITKEKGETK